MDFPVKHVKGFLSREECRYIIDKYNYGWSRAEVYNKGKSEVSTDRITDQVSIAVHEEPILQRCVGYLVSYNEMFLKLPITEYSSKINLLRYTKGGRFKMHKDRLPSSGNYRMISVSIILSDQYEGGRLYFSDEDTDKKKFRFDLGIGDMVIFPSTLYHQVTEITEGERYSLVAWLSGNEKR